MNLAATEYRTALSALTTLGQVLQHQPSWSPDLLLRDPEVPGGLPDDPQELGLGLLLHPPGYQKQTLRPPAGGHAKMYFGGPSNDDIVAFGPEPKAPAFLDQLRKIDHMKDHVPRLGRGLIRWIYRLMDVFVRSPKDLEPILNLGVTGSGHHWNAIRNFPGEFQFLNGQFNWFLSVQNLPSCQPCFQRYPVA